ncbi:hypothetical protein M0657_002640 [Pyricularia oryzae]|nr:hypothetical protein M9X92_002071 [Pyricularia oryzae]KAI7928532.1 hypothetical protein M0657_002640 [Pyricularia oryzae]
MRQTSRVMTRACARTINIKRKELPYLEPSSPTSRYPSSEINVVPRLERTGIPGCINRTSFYLRSIKKRVAFMDKMSYPYSTLSMHLRPVTQLGRLSRRVRVLGFLFPTSAFPWRPRQSAVGSCAWAFGLFKPNLNKESFGRLTTNMEVLVSAYWASAVVSPGSFGLSGTVKPLWLVGNSAL